MKYRDNLDFISVGSGTTKPEPQKWYLINPNLNFAKKANPIKTLPKSHFEKDPKVSVRGRGSRKNFKQPQIAPDFTDRCSFWCWGWKWPPFWGWRPHTRAQGEFPNWGSNAIFLGQCELKISILFWLCHCFWYYTVAIWCFGNKISQK